MLTHADPLTPETRSNWTSRVIDFQFHKFYWENRWTVTAPEHIVHQHQMLEAVKGYERAIFRDNVFYPFRDHFNGTTGTLSNLLSNCFFHIYDAMLDQGIPVNAEADLKTLYWLVYRFNNRLPASEWALVQKIRTRLISQLTQLLPFLQSSYYAAYYELIERADRELLLPSSTCTYYKEHPEHRSVEFLKGRAPYTTEFVALGEPLIYKHGPCEYGPDYLDMDLFETIPYSLMRLQRVEAFFT
jgi:hypothetical protein